MIKVNLLASSRAAAPAKEWLPRDQRSALGGVAILVASALAVGGWWYYLSNQASAVDTRIAAAQTELVRLKDASKLVEQTTARKNELSERLSLIDRLRTAKREPVSLLETVSRSMPDGLWLLEIKQAGSSVQIDGRATSITAVTDFTERLQSSGFFKRPVEILATGTEEIEGTGVVKFSVKADPVPSQPAPGTAGTPGANPVAAMPSAPAGTNSAAVLTPTVPGAS
jgi:type IV pilus assembly protein PilN